MRVMVVGGGKVGAHLVDLLSAADNAVVLVESDPERARELASQTKAIVLEGDGSDVRMLHEADCAHTDYLVAVTGSDEDNLVACQLARTAFGCEKVLARVNDPRNEATFAALEVPRVSVTDLLVQILSQHIDVGVEGRLAALGRGEAALIEIQVPDDRLPAAVAALGLPDATILAAIRRGDDLIIPTGTDQVLPGDHVMLVTYLHNEAEARAVIRGEYG